MSVPFKNYVVRSNNFRTAPRNDTAAVARTSVASCRYCSLPGRFLHGIRLWFLLLMSDVMLSAGASCSIRDFDVPGKYQA